MTYEDVLTVAVVNFKLSEGNKESNLRRMKGFAEAASKRGADLILFPEMCLMGCDYFMSADIPQESKRALAEPFDGPSAQAMAEISKNMATTLYTERHRVLRKVKSCIIRQL